MDSGKMTSEVLRVRQNATTKPKDMKMSLPTWMGAIFMGWLSKISFSVEIKLSYN
jgi:hypothetical protein